MYRSSYTYSETIETVSAKPFLYASEPVVALKTSSLLQLCFSKNPKVRVVVTAVTLETVGEMLCCAKELGQTFPNLCFEVTQVSCARSRQAGNYHLMNGMNPVWIGCLFQKKSQTED